LDLSRKSARDAVVGAPHDVADREIDPSNVDGLNVMVVGAGVFGGWTALRLFRAGARVSLIDAWGPANGRASSFAKTRVLRAVYGPHHVYSRWVKKSLNKWREAEERWSTTLFRRTGCLWMLGDDTSFVDESLPVLDELQWRYNRFTVAEAERNFPQIDFDGVSSVLMERDAGYILATHACRLIVEKFLEEGGAYLQDQVTVQPADFEGNRLKSVTLTDGSKFSADVFVFACGAWLPKLFPEILDSVVKNIRQENFHLGMPAGNLHFHESRFPTWVDISQDPFYGVPATDHHGIKIANEAKGEHFDPTTGDRVPTPERIEQVRAYCRKRFPGLADAPVVAALVSQNSETPDGHLLIDRHPAASNVLFVGGGSGHGFKIGPAVGEYAASFVGNDDTPDSVFSCKRSW